jgi:PAS domain-containing protein
MRGMHQTSPGGVRLLRPDGGRPPAIVAIPSTDSAFRLHVQEIVDRGSFRDPTALTDRLRLLYPRAVVRTRMLAGELPTWYVYRDGRWRPNADLAWWTDDRAGHLEVTMDGWILAANATARGLLGIGADEPLERYYTDFVAPGTVGDAASLFAIVAAGNSIEATIRIRPTSGDVIAVDLRAVRDGAMVAWSLRLADDIEPEPAVIVARPTLRCLPADDAVFASLAERSLARLPEARPAELAIRLRRLYPHAQVFAEDDRWTAIRDASQSTAADHWWRVESLPEVRYTDRGLILEANHAAVELLGSPLVGHHWHELVTPGTTSQVDQVIDLIVAQGGALSRFRMPARGGELIEFDSFTEVRDGILRTVMRPQQATAETR